MLYNPLWFWQHPHSIEAFIKFAGSQGDRAYCYYVDLYCGATMWLRSLGETIGPRGISQERLDALFNGRGREVFAPKPWTFRAAAERALSIHKTCGEP